ncbi:MAG TPA: hypothetical protein VF715_06130 [Thermoleophilaceae bacterium]
MPVRRSLALLLAAMALGAGCGGGDEDGGEKGGAPESGGVAKVAEDALIDGAEGRKIADVAIELLNAPNGDDPCYAIVASDYMESLGGLEGCAKKLGPIATGPFDTVVAAGPKDDGETGTADVATSDGGEKQTIDFAKTVAGEWRIDGLK